MPPSPTASKAEWRTWARAKRATLEEVSDAVQEHLCGFLRERRVRHVLAYRAFEHEVSLEGLPALLPETCFYSPRAQLEPEPRLTLHPWDSATQRSTWGILEPGPDALEVPLGRMEAILVPGLTFDAAGYRVGYGKGFYDRLLRGLSARVLTVGVCHRALRVERLPREAHDETALWVADEAGVHPVY